ncbi:MAG: hypothetical protein P9M15_00305, partial [Candidatus Electryoneaceae bacterium]|nr:hypothetical protein [Candidatus Electryoneaceae bacterium]
ALLLLRQRGAVGLITFSQALTELMDPRSAMGWLTTLTTTLENLESSGETNVTSALYNIAERVRRKGLVILISDLLDEPEKTIAAMKAVRHVGHDLIVFQILDPLERSFDFPRDARFRDLETGEVLPSRPWHIKTAYRREVERFIDDYRLRCRQEQIDYHLFTTDTPYETALFEFLARRKKLL